MTDTGNSEDLRTSTRIHVIGTDYCLSCACAVGVALAVFAPGPGLTIFGFALMGIGCANVVPILYSAAGASKSMSAEHAIAATATLGYAGTLTGPAAIGFIAHGVGLPAAFGLLAALLVTVCLVSNIVPKHEQTDAPD